MSDVVFILGAGASAQAGAPLMANFLDVPWSLLAKGALQSPEKESFERVFKARGALQHVHSKAAFDIHNVESVFAALEMAKTLGKFPRHDAEKIDGLIQDMKILIAATIEHTLLFPAKPGDISYPPPYESFVELIKYLRDIAIPRKTVSIITFNYDIAIDFALHKCSLNVDYAVDGATPQDSIPLLKLHGSLNWAPLRNHPGEVFTWHLNQFLPRVPIPPPWTSNSVSLPIVSALRKSPPQDDIIPEPIIVPPTWNKTDYHEGLRKVWRRAASELQEAQSIFVIGYSLPETDLFFRYLYALGCIGPNPLEHFWVINPDRTDDIRERFDGLLGPGAKSRFRYHPVRFAQAIQAINAEFGSS
ncbi:MAG: hypothetical protein AB1473_01980 [Thermodesulfobacteriota bacterium]